MQLNSYIVDRDFGFAPNPFHGVCTLATCKPVIRRCANVGDWIIGTGGSKRKVSGHLIFVMLVTETMSFNDYWNNPRFECKKPNLRGSLKQAFGDNIYHQNDNARWQQLNSHHSHADGQANVLNIVNDTKTNRVLLSSDFAYWGEEAPIIPKQFRNYDGQDICAGRGHKNKFSDDLITKFIAWFQNQNLKGFLGAPLEWRY